MKVRAVKNLSKDTSISAEEICTTFRISRSTYYRYLAMQSPPEKADVAADEIKLE